MKRYFDLFSLWLTTSIGFFFAFGYFLPKIVDSSSFLSDCQISQFTETFFETLISSLVGGVLTFIKHLKMGKRND